MNVVLSRLAKSKASWYDTMEKTQAEHDEADGRLLMQMLSAVNASITTFNPRDEALSERRNYHGRSFSNIQEDPEEIDLVVSGGKSCF